jgi:thiamine-phosphate pyrophosphorylase
MATEQASAGLTRRSRAALLHGIYLIVNEGDADVVGLCERGLEAGVRVIQYRAKNVLVSEHVRALRTSTARYCALLIVNDDWRAAVAYDCDGVHVGPGDDGFSDLAALRSAIGPERLIGVSCGSVAEAAGLDIGSIDYVGVGTVYATGSKPNAGEPIGVGGLSLIAKAVAPLPVAAIGGIDAVRLSDVRATGAAMAAVISAVSAATDPGDAATELVKIWSRA